MTFQKTTDSTAALEGSAEPVREGLTFHLWMHYRECRLKHFASRSRAGSRIDVKLVTPRIPSADL